MVIAVHELQSFYHGCDSGCFRWAKPVLFQIQIVNNRSETVDGRVAEPEGAAERLERAMLAVMAELHPEHVEGNRVSRNGLAIGRESEPRLRIDETLDQPRTSHSVDRSEERRVGKECRL